MTFDDILAQVLDLCSASSGPLSRPGARFALEEADLEARKDELIYDKRLAVDEDDRVPAGGRRHSKAPASQAPQSTTTQADHRQSGRSLLPPSYRPIFPRGRTPPAHRAVL